MARGVLEHIGEQLHQQIAVASDPHVAVDRLIGAGMPPVSIGT
jgi:hypothetical protein